jgi:peptide/nickel transport system ATP-binding protein
MKGTTATPLLEVRDLSVGFPTDDGEVHAVRGVSFQVNEGEVVGIVGESGSGKSVTSLAAMGLLPRSAHVSGSVKVQGQELIGQPQSVLRTVRGNKLAMVFQDPMTSLNPVYTIGWQIAEMVRAHNDISKKAAKARAIELLGLVGIPEPARRVDGYPHEFSGGMRQRAMIAMAIANDPDVLIADEPTTALDVTVQAQILELLLKVKENSRAAIVLITHDLGVVAGMVDRMHVMYAGTIVEAGTVDELFYRPRMPYTIGLLGSTPSTESDGRPLRPIKGAPPSLLRVPTSCPFAPRCPIVADRCRTQEPPLVSTDTLSHLAACWKSEELATRADVHDLFEAGAAL